MTIKTNTAAAETESGTYRTARKVRPDHERKETASSRRATDNESRLTAEETRELETLIAETDPDCLVARGAHALNVLMTLATHPPDPDASDAARELYELNLRRRSDDVMRQLLGLRENYELLQEFLSRAYHSGCERAE